MIKIIFFQFGIFLFVSLIVVIYLLSESTFSCQVVKICEEGIFRSSLPLGSQKARAPSHSHVIRVKCSAGARAQS